jgi:hypothetical protein
MSESITDDAKPEVNVADVSEKMKHVAQSFVTIWELVGLAP